MAPFDRYYQNNHLLLIISSSGEVLNALQLFVNNSQYVADSVDWSVGLVLEISPFRTDFLSSIYRPNKTFAFPGLKIRFPRRKRENGEKYIYMAEVDRFWQKSGTPKNVRTMGHSRFTERGHFQTIIVQRV
jgi:hypothetical protein